MLNPIKTPQQMMFEQARIPHYGAGNIVKGIGKELMDQFGGRVQEAVRKYFRATGKMPTREEIQQLEQHIASLKSPTPSVQQPRAVTATAEPHVNKFVDKQGRPYSAVPNPKKPGQVMTPEAATGYGTQDQFGMEPRNLRARQPYYEPPHINAFGEDTFTSVVNAGRTPNRTWLKSITPSTEDLAEREMAAVEREIPDEMGGLSRVQSTEGDVPTQRPSAIAEMAGALEAPAMDKISTDILMGEHKKLVRKIEQEFRNRGIVPDEEDILNAVNAEMNPLRHNYTGTNPIGERPAIPRGAPSAEAQRIIEEWRSNARASGLPEKVVGEHPSKWNEKHQEEYLKRTQPGERAPFAKGWEDVEGFAMGGMIQSSNPNDSNFADGGFAGHPSTGMPQGMMGSPAPSQTWNVPNVNPMAPANMFHNANVNPNDMGTSPRDMQAEMMVKGYADGKIVKAIKDIDYPGAGRAIAQGATLGWSDEMEAAYKNMMNGGGYDEYLADIQAGQEQYRKKNPKLSMGLELAGGLPLMLVPGANMMTVPKLAAAGAMYGAGSADPGERLEGAAIGAPLGVAIPKGIQGLGKAGKAAYKAARTKMMNPEARIAQEFTDRPFDYRSGMKTPSSAERQQWIGQAHEAGVKAFEQNDPAYKAAVYASWLKARPDMVRATGAQNYDQLMEAVYGQAAKETSEQFKRLPTKVQMYGPDEANKMDYIARAQRLGVSPAEFMRQKLKEGKPFNIFKDTDNPHPYLAKRDPLSGMNENEKFRAVHDYFGHLGTKKPNTFGPQGEENAWMTHRQMYSPLAEPAMTAETRGANSWVNYVNPENVARRKKKLPTTEYAENKPVLLPAEASDPAYAGGMPEYLKRIVK